MRVAKSRTLLPTAIAAFAVVLSTSAANAAKIMIVNGTRVAMVSLQSRSSNNARWSDDLLNRRSLGVGRVVLVDLPNGQTCSYDFFAMFYDGHKIQKKNVNVCKRGPVTIGDI